MGHCTIFSRGGRAVSGSGEVPPHQDSQGMSVSNGTSMSEDVTTDTVKLCRV